MRLYLEVVVIFVLILANGFLSMAEMALVSARKVRLRQQAEEGDPRAARQVVSSKSRFDPDMAEKRRTGRLVGPGHPVDPGVETFIGKRSHPERQRLRLEPERDHRAG